MPTLSYPSPLTPAAPRVRVDVPDGWEQLDLPAVLLAAREAGRADDVFATNLTIRHLVRAAEVTEEDLVAELRDRARGQDQGVLSGTFPATVDGADAAGA